MDIRRPNLRKQITPAVSGAIQRAVFAPSGIKIALSCHRSAGKSGRHMAHLYARDPGRNLT
jgi:hypothetical protein